jgi:hypothetical protein
MWCSGAGEIIVDALTISPSLSGIASASALLDASNYTVWAITMGKDSSGYQQHAHVLPATPETDGIIRVLSHDLALSGYHSSSTAVSVSAGFDLLPSYPHPDDFRLERLLTETPIGAQNPGVFGGGLGHNLNTVITGADGGDQVSAFAGCYPADEKSGTIYYILSSASARDLPFVSGVLLSYYNTHEIMDEEGYLTVLSGNAFEGDVHETNGFYNSGANLAAETTFSSTGEIRYSWPVSAGDGGACCLFGGIYQIGLYCLDLKGLLAAGSLPPYSFSILNNPRKYKLFAKKVLTRDLTYVEDVGANSGFALKYGTATPATTIFVTYKLDFV